MRNRLLGIALLAAAAGGLALSTRGTARACSAVMPRDQTVAVASETALIVWEEKAKRQHFIRRASFQTDVPYFGFLVPTPTRPELAETPDDLFMLLEDWTKPAVVTQYIDRHLISFGCMASKLERGNMAPAGQVAVVEQGRVAGHDYQVLKADDTKALQDWLAGHNYDARPQVMEWIDPYVKAGWWITAFQITKQEQQVPQVATQAIRMSFAAERPFFP